MGLVMHEMMHHSFWLHNYDTDKEEEIITWAEEETYEVLKTIEKYSREKLALE
jgi:NTP pyrophosphatase (non-canonical NTP hydrolase)